MKKKVKVKTTAVTQRLAMGHTFIALITVGSRHAINIQPRFGNQRYSPQIGSPFLISAPSFTRTSTTTPDMGAPTDPGSDVAFSRDTVSTAEFLSSTETARTYAK